MNQGDQVLCNSNNENGIQEGKIINDINDNSNTVIRDEISSANDLNELDLLKEIGKLPENIKNFLENSPELSGGNTIEKSDRTLLANNSADPNSSIALRNALKVLERDMGSKLNTGIDSLNEKLFQLQNIVKLSKDVENIEKENIVKNDIKKKLTLKEKWLSDFNANVALMQNSKHDQNSKHSPDNKVSKIDEIKNELAQTQEPKTKNKEEAIKNKLDEIRREIQEEKLKAAEEAKLKLLKEKEAKQIDLEEEDVFLDCVDNEKSDRDFENILESIEEQSESSKINFRPKIKNLNDQLTSVLVDDNDNNNEKERYFDFQQLKKKFNNPKYDPDIGQLLYDIENRFSPPTERKMSNALKTIENQSFSDTRGAIASQISTPKISKQASLDLSKFFPSQKLEKSATVVTKQPQKTLKDVDLNKYFPKSPVPQRKNSVTNCSQPAGGIRRSQTEKTIPALYKPTMKEKMAQAAKTAKLSNESLDTPSSPKPKPKAKISCLQKPTAKEKLNMQNEKNLNSEKSDNKSSGKVQPSSKIPELVKKPKPNILHYKPTIKEIIGSVSNESQTNEDFNIFHNQLDGSDDILEEDSKKQSSSSKKSVKTTTKNNGKTENESRSSKKKTLKNVQEEVPPLKLNKEIKKAAEINESELVDCDDNILNEILDNDNDNRSPSLEYQRLFQEEKSPSEDLSDKIEAILENSNIVCRSANKKKITSKAQSLSEEEFRKNQKLLFKIKEEGDRSKMEDSLKRFGSLNLVKKGNLSSDSKEKLSLSNSSIQKSTESIKSKNSLSSSNSEGLSDLEKTMEYLKSGWKNEASSFLQKKRDNFFSKTNDKPTTKKEENNKGIRKSKTENSSLNKNSKNLKAKDESIETIQKKEQNNDGKNLKKDQKKGNDNDKNAKPDSSSNLEKRELLKRRLSDSIRQSLTSDLLTETDFDNVNVDEIFNEIVEELKTNSIQTPDIDEYLGTSNSPNVDKKIKDILFVKTDEADSKPSNSSKKIEAGKIFDVNIENKTQTDFKTGQDLNKTTLRETSSKTTDMSKSEQHKISDIKRKSAESENQGNVKSKKPEQDNLKEKQNTNDNSLPETKNIIRKGPPAPPPPPPAPALRLLNKKTDNENAPKAIPLANIIRQTAGKVTTKMLRKVPAPKIKPVKWLFENEPFTFNIIGKESTPKNNAEKQNKTTSSNQEQNDSKPKDLKECIEAIRSRSPSPSSIPNSKKSSTDTTDSIDKLFSQFPDDMLVDVEFDSEDELVSITPLAVIKKVNDENVDETFDNLFGESKITVKDIDNFNDLLKEVSPSLEKEETLKIQKQNNSLSETSKILEFSQTLKESEITGNANTSNSVSSACISGGDLLVSNNSDSARTSASIPSISPSPDLQIHAKEVSANKEISKVNSITPDAPKAINNAIVPKITAASISPSPEISRKPSTTNATPKINDINATKETPKVNPITADASKTVDSSSALNTPNSGISTCPVSEKASVTNTASNINALSATKELPKTNSVTSNVPKAVNNSTVLKSSVSSISPSQDSSGKESTTNATPKTNTATATNETTKANFVTLDAPKAVNNSTIIKSPASGVPPSPDSSGKASTTNTTPKTNAATTAKETSKSNSVISDASKVAGSSTVVKSPASSISPSPVLETANTTNTKPKANIATAAKETPKPNSVTSNAPKAADSPTALKSPASSISPSPVLETANTTNAKPKTNVATAAKETTKPNSAASNAPKTTDNPKSSGSSISPSPVSEKASTTNVTQKTNAITTSELTSNSKTNSDKDTVSFLEDNNKPGKTEETENKFPQKPPRKNKTSSSSSPDSSNILAKAKEVAKITEEMPPSIQDLMENYHKEIIDNRNIIIIPVENAPSLTFPAKFIDADFEDIKENNKNLNEKLEKTNGSNLKKETEEKVNQRLKSVKDSKDTKQFVLQEKNDKDTKYSKPRNSLTSNDISAPLLISKSSIGSLDNAEVDNRKVSDSFRRTSSHNLQKSPDVLIDSKDSTKVIQKEQLSLNIDNLKETTTTLSKEKENKIISKPETNKVFEKIENKLRRKSNDVADKQNDDWKIIEKLEKERLIALHKRDEVYANQNQDSFYATPSSRLQKQTSQESHILQLSPTTTSTTDVHESALSKPSSDLELNQTSLLERRTSASLLDDKGDSSVTKTMAQENNKPEESEVSFDIKNPKIESLKKQKWLSSDNLDKKPCWPGLEDEDDIIENQLNKAKSLTPHSSEVEMPIKSNIPKSSNDSSVDRGTQLLLERSQWLREKKRDFMDEKKGCNNPYIRKMIDSDRTYHVRNTYDESDNDEDLMESYRPTPRKYFPTSSTTRSSSSGRRYNTSTYIPNSTSTYTTSAYNPTSTSYMPSTSGYNATSSYYYPSSSTYYNSGEDYHTSRLPNYSNSRYTSPYSSSTGYSNSRSYNDYSKRSPSNTKDSCRLS